MIHITPERLREVVSQVVIGAGAPESGARQVASSLVENDLAGHTSHGVLRVGWYVSCIENGSIDPHWQITTVRETATTAVLDGGRNFGNLVAREAMARAINKARAHDLGMVAIRNNGHTGRMGEYVVQAAQEGFMGMVFGAGSRAAVAPYLGIGRVFNTNPIAWGVPADQHPPVFMDFATSVVAQGKIQAAIDKGAKIPDGWLLDAEGNPSNDPNDQRNGGVMLPFGKHKGYCLSFLVELLSAGLTGGRSGMLPGYAPDYTMVLMAVNIAAFQPLDEFRRLVDEQVAATKASRRAPGVEEILVPGEPEWYAREKNLRDGLYLPDAAWQRIVEAGARHGVAVAL